MKQAFLIIAHGDFSVLRMLIDTLSCDGTDIYVHIDAKVKDLPELFLANGCNLYILKDRVDTRWGDYSQIETELTLLEAANNNGPYSHYHIISGTHFPLKSTDYILKYYDGYPDKVILSGLCQSTELQETLKLKHYNIFTRKFAVGSDKSKKSYQLLWRAAHKIQDIFKIVRNKNVPFYKASNWVSLTEETACYILNNKKTIRKIFKWSYCGDEYFIPTLLMNSIYKDNLLNSKSILLQEMGKANARTFCIDDLHLLSSSECLFARKFSDRTIEVVKRLSSHA